MNVQPVSPDAERCSPESGRPVSNRQRPAWPAVPGVAGVAPWTSSSAATRYARGVATSKAERVSIEVAGREIAISNPSKVYFPEAGITKLEVVRYYLAVAEGALRGAGDRPNVLVLCQRDPRRFLLPEARARLATGVDRGRRPSLPVRPHRRGGGAARRGGAGLDGEPRVPGAPSASRTRGRPRASR